jgi:hypothetical protein
MIKNIRLEVGIPNENSVIPDASLLFEVTGTQDAIKNFENVIAAEIKQQIAAEIKQQSLK